MNSLNWQELNIRGFTVIRKAIPAAFVQSLFLEAESGLQGHDGSYKPWSVGRQSVERLKAEHFNEILRKIHEHTDIRADSLQFANYLGRKNGVNFPWHSDHIDFYLSQDFYNYLNLYLPVKKPVAEKSNVSIMAMDRLHALAPNVAKHIRGRGAMRVIERQDHTLFIDGSDESVHIGPFRISEQCETPHLEAGDLLVMRGDVIHRTQDVDTDRVAATFRVFNSKGIIKKSDLQCESIYKTVMVADHYEMIFRVRRLVFELQNADQLTYSQLEAGVEKLSQQLKPKTFLEREREVTRDIVRILSKMDTAFFVMTLNADHTSDVQSLVNAAGGFRHTLFLAHEVPGSNALVKVHAGHFGLFKMREPAQMIQALKSCGVEFITVTPRAFESVARERSKKPGRVLYFIDFNAISKSSSKGPDNIAA